MRIVNLNVGEGRSRPCAGSPERETEARRGAGCGPAPTRQCGTEPQLDGPPLQSPPPQLLSASAQWGGVGGGGLSPRLRLRRPGVGGIRCDAGEGLPPRSTARSGCPGNGLRGDCARPQTRPAPCACRSAPHALPGPRRRLSAAGSAAPRAPWSRGRPGPACAPPSAARVGGRLGRDSLRLRGATTGRARTAGPGGDSSGRQRTSGSAGLRRSGGRASRGTEDSGGRCEEGDLSEQTGEGGRGRAGRGPEENGDLARMEGGAALWPQSAAGLDRGPAAARLRLRAQSISHSANICGARPVCRTQ